MVHSLPRQPTPVAVMEVTHCDIMSHPWGTQVKTLLQDPLERGGHQGAAQSSLLPAEHVWLFHMGTPESDLVAGLSNATSPL